MLVGRFISIAFLRLRAVAQIPRAQKPDTQDDKLSTGARGFSLGCATQDAKHFIFFHDDEVFAINLDLGAGVFAEQDAITIFYCQGEDLAFIVASATADGDDFALLRLIFSGIGDNDATAGGGSFLHATDQDAIV